MKRLYVVAEGLTEVQFVSRILAPYIGSRSNWHVAVRAPNLRGHYTYERLKKEVKLLMASPGGSTMVTTMIDLFKLPNDFPAREQHWNNPEPLQRVQSLEHSLADDIADSRFHPYLQLHEFEALLLFDIEVLAMQHPNRTRVLRDLARRLRKQFSTPEHVNQRHPPSYRIRAVVPEYQKVRDGVITAERITLDRLRKQCPHFGQWIHRLESLV